MRKKPATKLREKTAKVVLLMGAGSSAIIGLPTLDQLLSSKKITPTDPKSFQIVENARLVVQTTKYGNAVFEELIPLLRRYLDCARMFREDFFFRQQFGELPNAVTTGEFEAKWKRALVECYRLLAETYGPQSISPNCEGLQATLTLLKALADLNGGELHVFTTNYDCAFQVMALHYDRRIKI